MKQPPQDLLHAAQLVLPHAYAPYSHFFVSASVRSENQTIFAGCNVENASFSATICAEGSAISALIASGAKKIIEALILVPDKKICPPCGICRQRLIEFASPDIVIHLCTTSGLYQHTTLGQLLPMAFQPTHLDK